MISLLIGICKYVEVEKEFFVLVSIFLVLGIILWKVNKAYTGFMVKQEHCDGRFKLQDFKINKIDEKATESKNDSKEALDLSKKALNCATRMGDEVKKVSENFEAFLSGKFEVIENDERNS